jgi:hypothetical protein
MISAEDFDTLRSIARAGEDYATIKQLLAATQWEVEEDNADLGFLRVFITYDSDKHYRLIIGYRDSDRPPYSLLTLSVFPDSEEHIAAFNAAFHSTAETLARYVDAPSASGERQLSSRTWSYAYCRWSLPEGEFTLVQDEFDIQEGLDVTLWIQPVGTPINETLQL